MPSIRLQDLSPFARLALRLDQEFADLSRAGERIAKLDVESDGGLDEGLKILNRVAKQGGSVAATMQEFSKALQEARDGAQAAAKLVEERAHLIQKRRQQEDALEAKLGRVKDAIKTAGAGLTGLKATSKAELSAELERLQAPITAFIEGVREIKAEAAKANFKRLERQADSMIDTLLASRKKISQALGLK